MVGAHRLPSVKTEASQSHAVTRSATHLKRLPQGRLSVSTRCGLGEERLITLKQACSKVIPPSATCVQRFDDSRSSAIHITYRSSLRSSSMQEPRYPLLTVVFVIVFCVAVPPPPQCMTHSRASGHTTKIQIRVEWSLQKEKG